MAFRTLISYPRMGSFQLINLVMDRETRRCPICFRSMATRTVGGQVQRFVIRACSIVEVSRMAIHTFSGCTGIPTGMTFNAINCSVRTRQREFSFIMIKGGRFPGRLIMATFTTGGKIRCLMIWICG